MQSNGNVFRLTNEAIYNDIFEGIKCSINRFPNIIIADGPNSLSEILHVIERKGVWWEEILKYSEEGDSFYEKYKSSKDLKLWITEKNQEYMLSNAGYNNGSCLTTIIDSETPLHVFEDYSNFIRTGKSIKIPWLDNMLPYIIEYIDEIRWAFIPLSGDYPLALFLAHTSETELIEKIKKKLQSDDKPFCTIISKNGRDFWELPESLRRYS